MKAVGVVILAAGGSRRMGCLKQLLPYQGRSLLLRAVETALRSTCRPIVVVIGACARTLRNELRDARVHVVENPAWPRGIGASIGRGVACVQSLVPQPAAVLLMLCDQPLVSTGLINRIAEAYRSGGHGIVACQYAGTVGPPALFDRRFLPELANLKGRQGAKRIIQMHRHDALFIPFPGSPDERVFVAPPGAALEAVGWLGRRR